jgi:hypothetical protein
MFSGTKFIKATVAITVDGKLQKMIYYNIGYDNLLGNNTV